MTPLARRSWMFLTLILAFPSGWAQVPDSQSALMSQEEKLRLERERILAGIGPHWADLRALVEATQEEAKALAFLSTHSRLADRYSSPGFFLDQLGKWTGRLGTLPQDMRKVDPKRIELDFLRSGGRETVVLTFRTPDTNEFVRLNGIYIDGELSLVNITKGFATPFHARKTPYPEYDSYRGRKY